MPFLGFSQDISEENQPEITTYYLIRHAEKDRTNPNDPNPELTRKGYFRAEGWAKVFDKIPLDAIYSTSYNRTLMTAFHTSQKKKIEITLYDPKEMYSQEFQQKTKGKKVLIVGHSNTTPAFVNAIIDEKRYKDMADDDNSSLYVVTLIGDQSSVEIFTIN
ncbi:MAG: histidine phosphatase family protein [Flavobacteriaceae bacterium]|nr:histidine phosphatase family protein [Flavobacteriaceae bacterium]